MRDSKGFRRSARRLAPWALLLLGGAGSAGAAPEAFRAESLADDVLLFRPVEDHGARTNSLVVVREDGLLVVDAQPSPEAARELIAAVAERSPRPIRYLVLSHPHAEAAGGASAFPPSTLLIATADYLATIEDGSFDFGAETRARAADPDGWVEPPRRKPGLLLHGNVDLGDPKMTVRLQVLGRRHHSHGDLMVYLPGPNLLYIGGLLFTDGNPYARDGRVSSWLASLNRVLSMAPRAVVGLRGPAVDLQAIRRQRDALAWISGRVETRFIDGVPLGEIRDQVLGEPGLAEWFRAGVSPSFLPLLVEQVMEEAIQQRRKRGRM